MADGVMSTSRSTMNANNNYLDLVHALRLRVLDAGMDHADAGRAAQMPVREGRDLLSSPSLTSTIVHQRPPDAPPNPGWSWLTSSASP